MDIFIEKIVNKKKDIKDFLYYAGTTLLTLILLIAVVKLTSVSPFFQALWFLLMAAVLYLGWILLRRRNIEYEYAITNGELDIDIIIDQKSRKKLFNQDCRNFDIVAPYPEESSENNNLSGITDRIEAVSTMASSNIYFIITYSEKKRIVIFFEPDSRMLAAFKSIIPRKIKLRQADDESLRQGELNKQ